MDDRLDDVLDRITGALEYELTEQLARLERVHRMSRRQRLDQQLFRRLIKHVRQQVDVNLPGEQMSLFGDDDRVKYGGSVSFDRP